MRAFSSVVSITVHVGLGAAVLVGTAKAGRSDPSRPIEPPIVFQPSPSGGEGGGASLPGPITVVQPDIGNMSITTPLPQTGALMPSFSPVYAGTGSTPSTGQPGGMGTLFPEEQAEVLSGPLPIYPDLLRQAGVQGRVVLEAVVDTIGRVLAQSISVVSATNPGFVDPARQALQATLFRPATVGGKTVRMLVRIPYEFALRDGTGRAR